MTKLEELEVLTARLKFKATPSRRLLEVHQETPGVASSTLFGLLHTEEVAVIQMYTGKNSEFVSHGHKEYEFVVLYEGQLVITTPDNVTTYVAPTMVFFPPYKEHQVTCTKDTKMIVISVPGIEAWPDGEKINGRI